MKIDYTKLTFTQLVDKIETNRFFDLPRMVREAFRRLTPQEPKYKVYTALLSQSDTDAPVATVLENTLGDIVWSRINSGEYLATLNGVFLEDKTDVRITANTGQGNTTITNIQSVDSVYVALSDSTDDLSDELLRLTPIEIRVYN